MVLASSLYQMNIMIGEELVDNGSIAENYMSNPEPSCSSGRLSKTVHKLYHYDDMPESYEFYQQYYY